MIPIGPFPKEAINRRKPSYVCSAQRTMMRILAIATPAVLTSLERGTVDRTPL